MSDLKYGILDRLINSYICGIVDTTGKRYVFSLNHLKPENRDGTSFFNHDKRLFVVVFTTDVEGRILTVKACSPEDEERVKQEVREAEYRESAWLRKLREQEQEDDRELMEQLRKEG